MATVVYVVAEGIDPLDVLDAAETAGASSVVVGIPDSPDYAGLTVEDLPTAWTIEDPQSAEAVDATTWPQLPGDADLRAALENTEVDTVAEVKTALLDWLGARGS